MRKILLLVLMVSLIGCSTDPAQKCDKELKKIMKTSNVVGLSVAVVKDNKIIYANSFGVKDLDTKEALTNDDIFRIASISKSFSATSVMQLREKGLLSLDEDVSNLAGFTIRNPKYPDNVITLRMLMSHRSSINDSQGYYTDLNVINPDVNPDWAKCYNDYAPDGGYEYCNLNYNLIGSFIEKVSGERFDRYVAHHILEPLGLYGGYCVDSLDSSKFVTLYNYDDSLGAFVSSPEAYEPRSEKIANYEMGKSTVVFSPTGGMKISATGLAKYMIMHMNYGTTPEGVLIMSEESSRLMQTPQSKDFAKYEEHPEMEMKEEDAYGMAMWRTNSYVPGVVLVGHTGGAYGLRSEMFFNPAEKYGFVAISSGAQDEEILKTVIRCLYGVFEK